MVNVEVFATTFKKWCFGLTFALVLIVFGPGEAWACGDLLLASQGVDFGKLSCDASGYVVLNPLSTTNLIGFKVSTETVKGKGAVAGAPFQFTPNGKVQVVEKLTGSNVTKFKCKQSANGIVSLPGSAAGTDFIITKVEGKSEEMSADVLEICPTKPMTQVAVNIVSDYTVLDMDNDLLSNGHTFYTNLGGKDWSKPKKINAYFSKDNSSADRVFQANIYLKNVQGVDTLVSSQSLYSVKSTVPAFSPSTYEVTLDYRYDPSGKINARLRGLMEGVAAEFRAFLKENSKSNYSGDQFTAGQVAAKTYPGIYTPVPYALVEGYDDTSTANLPAPAKKIVVSVINEFFDDMTIYVAPLTFLESGTGGVIPGSNTTLLASANERLVATPPSFYNNNSHTPYMGMVRMNVDKLTPLTDEQIRGILRHEMIHVFGGVNVKPYPSGSTTSLSKVIGASAISGGNYNGPNVLAKNGNASIPMDLEGLHFSDSVSAAVLTLMRKTETFSYPTSISTIDKAVIADNGFCVAGINDSPSCN
jgi:hypothetical protein